MDERLACLRFETRAAAYLDDALPVEMRRRLELHLEGCAKCRTELDSLRWTIGCLASLPREAIPPGMKKRLLDTSRSHSPLPRLSLALAHAPQPASN